MFSIFKTKNSGTPSGYPVYTAADFEKRFAVPGAQSRQIEVDYMALLRFDSPLPFGTLVFRSGRNLFLLSQIVEDRYQVDKVRAAAISLFFANIAIARTEQMRLGGLGIKQSTWMVATCGSAPDDPNKLHASLAGQVFDPAVGAKTPDGHLLPSTAIGCTCIGRPKLQF